MTDKPKKQEGLSLEELEAQNIERLPDREEMSLVDVRVALPLNAAVSANIPSEDPTTAATDQSNS